jgi:hypothetical protein
MSQITINTINGTPPYTIYVCSTFLLNCTFVTSGLTSLPFTFSTPSAFTYSPSVTIKVIDSQNCEYVQYYNCATPTPTRTPFPTPTPTSSITPTPNITPSNTQTPATATPTPSPTVTPSITPTLTVTPSTTPQPLPYGLLFIEPITGSYSIGNYMDSKSALFFGFSNAAAPSSNQLDFDYEINSYMDFSGWTSGEFPVVLTTNFVDIFNSPVTNFNFLPINLSANTISGDAWYTFIIPTGFTNGQYQKSVSFSTDGGITQTTLLMNPTIYSNYFNYTGYSYNRTTYRVYTTFPSPEFLLSNDTDLFFSGSTIGT